MEKEELLFLMKQQRYCFKTDKYLQYVDEQGKPAIKEPHNPNGSMYAIEGITTLMDGF